MDTEWKEKFGFRSYLATSGHEDENATHSLGVVLMISQVAEGAHIGWEALGLRLVNASLCTAREKIKVHIILCYAQSTEKDKGEFYYRLHALAGQITSKGHDHSRWRCKGGSG